MVVAESPPEPISRVVRVEPAGRWTPEFGHARGRAPVPVLAGLERVGGAVEDADAWACSVASRIQFCRLDLPMPKSAAMRASGTPGSRARATRTTSPAELAGVTLGHSDILSAVLVDTTG